ncbi:hypothetical protein [Streptomyces niveus]|uniref:hypothetical protein n=1 Tax=Streptomyces niveus TaxID=193462 RepID=UPI0036D29426
MRYLGLTARQLRRDRTVDFAWWQINARITGPLVGLMYGAVWGALLYALFGPAIGVVTGLFTAAMSFAAHQFVRADLKQVSVPKEGVHGPGHLARHYARVGAASALLAGAVTGGSVGLCVAADGFFARIRARFSRTSAHGTGVAADPVPLTPEQQKAVYERVYGEACLRGLEEPSAKQLGEAVVARLAMGSSGQ